MPDVLTPTPERPAESSTSASSDDFMSFADAPENVIAPPAETHQSSQPDDPEGPQSDAVEETPGNTESDVSGGTQPGNAISFKGIKPEVVAVMKHLAATNSEYDLSNPVIHKLVRQAAEKELQIRKGTPTAPEASDYLNAFNDPEPAAPPSTETPKQGVESEVEMPSFVKVAKEWKTPADFTKSLYKAFDMDEGPEKEHAVSEVMLGFVDRTFHELYFPRIQRMVEHLQQTQLGPVLNEVQASREQQERSSVVQKLAGMPGTEDVMELFDSASDGEIEIEGEKVPDTWLNRIIVENPFILKIRVEGKTPAESKRKTLAEQYRAAHRLMKVQRDRTTDPTSAQRLIGAGQSLERSKRDPARTGLNAGKTGVPAGNRNGDDLFSSGNNSVSFNEVFK